MPSPEIPAGRAVVSQAEHLDKPIIIVGAPRSGTTNLGRVLSQHPAVAYAEPDYRVEIANIPNDPRFDEQWDMHNVGQSGGVGRRCARG